MHDAHPPRVRWHVETHDPLANEWSSGLPLLDRQTAVRKRTHLDETRPTWKDGTPVQRRIVLETTTFEDLDADVSHLGQLPNGGFIITGVGGQDFAALPDTTPDGRPAIRFCVGSDESGHADAVLPLDLLEEVIAGQRDVARQAAYKVAYHQPTRFPGDSAAMRAAAICPVQRSAEDEAALALIRAAEGAGA